MSLESIIAKIEAESRAQGQAVLQRAREQAGQLLDEARQQAETARKTALEKGERQAKYLARRLVQAAELKARKQLLQLKQELVQEVFQAALEKLEKLPPAEYRLLLRRMLLAQELSGAEQVICSAADRRILADGFIGEINAELKRRGLPAALQLQFDERLGRGGFILRRGKVENNNTFGAMLRAGRDELELEVARALFGEQE